MRKCPYCAEEIQDEAIKCKHCEEIFVKEKPLIASKKRNILINIFSGRLNRRGFGVSLIFSGIIFFSTFLFYKYFCEKNIDSVSFSIYESLLSRIGLFYYNDWMTILRAIAVLTIFSLWIIITAGWIVRRLHDLDLSGWYLFCLIIPIINFPFAVYISIAPGTEGLNRYGQMPSKNIRFPYSDDIFIIKKT